MAIVFTDQMVNAPADYPKMNPLYSDPSQTYQFATRIYYDNTWVGGIVGRPAIGYLHGSGTTAFLPTNAPLVTNIIGKGNALVSMLALGIPPSSREPFRFGYGNVNSPHFMAGFIKDAFWAEAMYNFLLNSLGNGANVAILGQSMGAGAAVAWSAGMSGRTSFNTSRFKGIMANAATVAGLGDGSFNTVVRNVSTMSYMIERLKTKAVLTYGDADVYAPPEYARRVQSRIPVGKDTYVLTPGNHPHGWMNTAQGAPIAADWVNRLVREQTIVDRFGNPAVAGPVA